MMRTLRLNEGDPIRITSANLQKGTRVKLQPQHVHFLELSDPKAVCVTFLLCPVPSSLANRPLGWKS